MATVFIDGQAGTTGLQISKRLEHRDDIELLHIDALARKSEAARARLLQKADVAILCLPDDAAKEAVALADGKTRILDASTAYRVDPQWCYGLPELHATARAQIRSAQFVSNPGCYPQGFILLIRPLIDAGVLAPDTGLRCNAISGYSGGGRKMIEQFEAYDSATADIMAVQAYGLEQQHKHLPEMQYYSGCTHLPLFLPTVANYAQGMLVQVPLFSTEINGACAADIQNLLAQRYADEPFVQVAELGASDQLHGNYLTATARSGSNYIDLMVFGDDRSIVLCARYDNLGKGASGAAMQNLNIMLGIDEVTGL